MLGPVCTELFCKEKNVRIANIAKQNLRVITLIPPRDQILLAIMGDIYFFTRTAVCVVLEVPTLGAVTISVISPFITAGGGKPFPEG